MKSLVSLSVGIPAYNEEENISFLLKSLIRQKALSYNLEKIIVICDGCTDQTADIIAVNYTSRRRGIIRHIKKTYPIVSLIESKKQLGKKARLAQLYKLNQSDILLTCDADVVLSQSDVIEKMIQYFDENNVAVVGANNQPISADNFLGKLINQWAKVWYEVRSSFKKGHNVHNVRGTLMAIRKSFAKNIKFDGIIVSDAQFIYFEALRQKLKFRFAKDAIVLYRKPDNIYDYLLQTKRDPRGRKRIAQVFGEWIYKEYRIPFAHKIRALLKMLTLNPISTSLALIFHLALELYPPKIDVANDSKLWRSPKSTKKAINLGGGH